MIVFPPAKINLGLSVLRKRADGFHDIESVLMPIRISDALEVIVDPTLPPGWVEFSSSGIPIPGAPEANLCVKAIELLKRKRSIPGVRMHLHKVIPTGAGLGGGSSDGAHALRLLNRLLDLQLEEAVLLALATELGSDCPFFLSDRPQLVQGRGERLTPIALDLSGWWLLLANPGIHVGTAEVYSNTRPNDRTTNISEALAEPVERWQGAVKNDMERYVFTAYPPVLQLRDALLAHGATYAAMSGSGSSVFGLFRNEPSTELHNGTGQVWKVPL
ncbi:MAG: 4-(cytidine 5'-diphospho)-2-C-methyl-D-erythritol kinase [Flavobacteriales bacterium]